MNYTTRSSVENLLIWLRSVLAQYSTTNRVSAVCLIVLSIYISQLLIWDRGLYMDDYSSKNSAQSVETSAWKPLFEAPLPFVRDLGQIIAANTASAIPGYEFGIRFSWALIHAVNVIFAGLLVFRCTKNEYIAIMVSMIYAAPYLAHEMVLWHVLMMHETGVMFFLGLLHLLLWTIFGNKYRVIAAITAYVCILIGLQFSEMAVSSLVMLPIFVLVRIIMGHDVQEWKKHLVLAVGLTFVGLIVCAFYYIFYLGRSVAVSGRGGLVTNPIQIFANLGKFIVTAYWFALEPEWGAKLAKDAFLLGLSEIFRQPFGFFSLIIMIIAGFIWSFSLKIPRLDFVTIGYKSLIVCVIGLIWALISLLPGTLLAGQILEWRMLYVCLIGVAIFTAGVISLFGWAFGRYSQTAGRIIFLLPVIIALTSTVTLTGYARLYQLRYLLDTKQISGILATIPASDLPEKPVFVPVDLDPRLVSPPNINPQVLDRVLFGGFEIPYSARSILQMAYRKSDINVVTTHHWTSEMKFNVKENPKDQSRILVVDGHDIPLDHAIIFTYQNGEILLVKQLKLVDQSGILRNTVEIPFNNALNRKNVIDSLQVQFSP